MAIPIKINTLIFKGLNLFPPTHIAFIKYIPLISTIGWMESVVTGDGLLGT